MILASKAGASRDLLADLLEAYAAGPQAATVEVLLCGIGEQERVLRDGRADVAILHRPYDATVGLATEDLVTERQVVVVPAGHPIAKRSAVRLAEVSDLPDLPLPRVPGPDGAVPDGPGPVVRDHAQLYQLIALGRASWLAPESARSHLADGVAAVPVLDAPMVTTVIAWPPHSRSPALRDLVAVAVDLQSPDLDLVGEAGG